MRQIRRIEFGLLVLCAITLVAFSDTNSPSTEQVDALPIPYAAGMYSADLLIGDSITTGRQVVVSAATDYVEILSVRLKHKPREALFNMILRFQTRDVEGARIEVSLFDEAGYRVGHIIHTEDVGPESTKTQYAKALYFERQWDDPRSIWIEVPRLAETAVMFSLAVWPKAP